MVHRSAKYERSILIVRHPRQLEPANIIINHKAPSEPLDDFKKVVLRRQHFVTVKCQESYGVFFQVRRQFKSRQRRIPAFNIV